MGRLLAFAFLAVAASAAVADEYKIQNTRPTRLLAMLVGLPPKQGATLFQVTGTAQGLIPEGLVVQADDEKSVIRADGPADKLKEMARLIELMDVKTASIKAEIELSVPLEKYQSATTTTVRNSAAWRLQDQTAGLNVAITPRINDDGSITVLISASDGSQGYDMTIRKKSGEWFEVPLDGLINIRTRNVEKESAKRDPNMPVLRLKLTAVGYSFPTIDRERIAEKTNRAPSSGGR